MNKYLIIVLAIILIFALFCVTVSYLLCRYYAMPKRRTHKEQIERYKNMGILYEYEKYEFEEFSLELRDKKIINGRYFCFNKEAKKFVILVHGFGASQISMAKYMEEYIELGFNIITYDERGQSENEKCVCGMSFFEGEDVIEVINYVKKRFGDDIKLGIHGESMGAASVLTALRFNPKIDFCIADCPFAKLKLLSIKEAKNRYHVPMFIINLCGPIGKIFFKYNPNKVNPIEGINNSKVPLLICHGLNDNLIPYYHSQMLYDEYKGEKDILFVDGADHAQSITVNRNKYQNKVKEFINKYLN